jgi:hypothetical protein
MDCYRGFSSGEFQLMGSMDASNIAYMGRYTVNGSRITFNETE